MSISFRPPGGGVTVPSGVFIAPDQAWVNGSAQMQSDNSTQLSLSGIGATSFTSDGGINLYAIIFQKATSNTIFDHTNNAVSDPDKVNDLLGVYAGGNFGPGISISNCTINIYGGTNAPPPPVSPHADEIYTLDLNSVDVLGIVTSGGPVNFYFNNGTANSSIIFDPLTPFSGSSGSTVGIADLPTIAQIVAYLVANYSSIAATSAVDNLNGTAMFTDSTEADYPYSPSDSGTGIIFNEIQAGSSFVQNENLTTLLNNGNEVNTN